MIRPLKQRNFGLDIIRATAIILVLIAHKCKLDIELGIAGVQIFFVLSGYLIGQIALRDFYSGTSLWSVIIFWKNRWYRTLPLYYFVVTVMLLIKANPFGWKIVVYYFFLQANFVGIDFFRGSWSLVVEEWFYIFLPLGFLVFFRNGLDEKCFFRLIISFIICFFLTRFLWNYFHQGVIIYQFDSLMMGVLLAGLKLYRADTFQKIIGIRLAILGSTTFIILIVILGKMTDHSIFQTFYRVTWYSLVSLSVFFIIPYFESSKIVNRKLAKVKPVFFFFSTISLLSYSLYLIHPIIYSLNFQLLGLAEGILQLGLLFLCSTLLFIFYEYPFMSLREHLRPSSYSASVRNAVEALIPGSRKNKYIKKT